MTFSDIMIHYGYKYFFEYNEEQLRENQTLYFDDIVWIKQGKRLEYKFNHSIIQSLSKASLETLLETIESFDNGERDFRHIYNIINK